MLNRDSTVILPLPLTLKATPRIEGGERFIYCEPSNEATDLEGQRVLREALYESRDYFLQKGNLDLDHISLTGVAYGQRVENPRLYEIGRPLEVKFLDDRRPFVKGQIYKGSGPMVERANEFWSSITDLEPAMPWWPSVGGHVRSGGKILPKGEKAPVDAIKRVYWNNIGFAREPINPSVPRISLMPLGSFAKSYIGIGSHLQYNFAGKALTAGYGTDLATLEGGAALRRESLHGDPRKRRASVALYRAVESGQIPQITVQGLTEYLVDDQGMTPEEATECVTFFLSEVRDRTQRKELVNA